MHSARSHGARSLPYMGGLAETGGQSSRVATSSILAGKVSGNSSSSSSSLIARHKQKKTDSTTTTTTAHPWGLYVDYSLVAPIRQTASIFKQPVTIFKDHKSKVKTELKAVNKEKPAQLFWTRRLGNLNAVRFKPEEGDTEPPGNVRLPKKVGCVGPGISEKMVLASISTHLHLSKDAAVGQKENPELIEKNPAAFVNPHQPLMTCITVSEADILAAEARVKQARLRLAQAIKGLA